MLIFEAMDIETLKALKEKLAANALEDQEQAGQDIPFIREETLLRLARELNLPLDPKTEEIRRSISGEVNFSSFYLTRRMAEDEFRIFPIENEGFLFQMNEWLKKAYPTENPTFTNAATVGMTYIFRAFHVQEGSSFIDGLRAMPDGQTMTAFSKTTTALTLETGILKRMLTGQSIPQHQVFLKKGLDILKLVSPNESEIEEGAVAMYQGLSTLWPAIVTPAKRQMPKWY